MRNNNSRHRPFNKIERMLKKMLKLFAQALAITDDNHKPATISAFFNITLIQKISYTGMHSSYKHNRNGHHKTLENLVV